MPGPATFRLWAAFGEKALDSTRLASDANWTEIGGDCRDARFNTSTRRSEFNAFTAGKGQFVLDNSERKYDTKYSSGPYFGELKRKVPIRVTAEHASTRHTVWWGWARSWKPKYIGSHDSVVVLRAVDGLGMVAEYALTELASASYGRDQEQTRIGRVLDDIGSGYPYRSLGNGGPGPRLAATTWGTGALRHLRSITKASGSMVYCDRDGTITHDTRHASGIIARQKTSQVTLGHLTEPTYLDAAYDAVGDDYRDLVRISGATGIVQTADRTTDPDDAPTVWQELNSPILRDAQAQAAADFHADLFVTERQFPETVEVRIATSFEDIRTELLERRVRDRATVTHDPPGPGADLSDEVFIDGMRHHVDPTRGDWLTTFTLSSADQYDGLDGAGSWLVLDDATLGLLDNLRELAY